MESQPQNPEFRINPENLHPCKCLVQTKFCICIIIIIIIYLLFLKNVFSQILIIFSSEFSILSSCDLKKTHYIYSFPVFVCLFDLILYVPSTIFSYKRMGLPGLNQY